MGRKRKYATPEAMTKKADGYFAKCDKLDKPYTVSGLCVHLGMTRQALHKLAKENAEFTEAIALIKLRIESRVEEGLLKGLNPTGCIFALKNHFGWKDKTETETYGKDGGPIESKWTVEFLNASPESQSKA